MLNGQDYGWVERAEDVLLVKRNIAHCWNDGMQQVHWQSGSYAYVHAFTCVRPPLGSSAVAIYLHGVCILYTQQQDL